MPLTDNACPNCRGRLHTDDLLSGKCVTPGCGADLTEHFDGEKWNLPEYDEEEAPEGEHEIVRDE